MKKSIKTKTTSKNITTFFADTWWYAMTTRMSDENFLKLVKLRQQQGFDAAQIVVGIPPEVGIYNSNAKSEFGEAFNINGKINYKYLEFAKKRVKIMNEHNLTAIIYGAWGQQIDWISENKMCDWWLAIIQYFDDLNVIYCLTGKLDISLETIASKSLLPDKTSKENIFFKESTTRKILKNILKKTYTFIFYYNRICFLFILYLSYCVR